MAVKYENGEQFFHKLYTRFNASIAITLLPMGYLILLKLKESLYPLLTDDRLYYTVLITLLMAGALIMFFAIRNFKSSLLMAKEIQSLRGKLDQYFESSLRKYFHFSLSGVCFTIGLYLTANDLFTLSYIVGLALLSLGRPSLSAFFDDLQLSQEDKTILLEKRPIP